MLKCPLFRKYEWEDASYLKIFLRPLSMIRPLWTMRIDSITWLSGHSRSYEFKLVKLVKFALVHSKVEHSRCGLSPIIFIIFVNLIASDLTRAALGSPAERAALGE